MFKKQHESLAGTVCAHFKFYVFAFCVFPGCAVLYKLRTSCCVGEMSLPPGVSASYNGKHNHRADFSGASNTGQQLLNLISSPSSVLFRCSFFVNIMGERTFFKILKDRFQIAANDIDRSVAVFSGGVSGLCQNVVRF